MASEASQSFGEQAARFSLYAPFAVLILGLLEQGAFKESPSVALPLVVINLVLIVAGFGLGVSALLSIRRFGRKRILGRATLGVLLNGMILSALLVIFIPLIATGRMKSRLNGHWSIHEPQAGDIALTLDPDGSFQFTTDRDGARIVSLSGNWALTRSRILGITIGQVMTGDPKAVGQKIGLGTVSLVDEKQMILLTDKGREVYSRVAAQ